MSEMRERAMALIVALQQGHCDEPLHMKLDRRELDDLADTLLTFAITIAAEATQAERKRAAEHVRKEAALRVARGWVVRAASSQAGRDLATIDAALAIRSTLQEKETGR